MWAYYDVDLGGTGLAVTGALTLPFDADLAVSVESATLAHLWTFTGTTWISRSFDSLSWPWAAEFAHDPDRGGTELYFMFEECCRSTDAFDHYRMLAFAMDDAGSVWSAFPTHNALDGPFEYFYQWPILVDHYDLLKQPVSAQQPYVTMRFSSLPPSQKTLSSGETVTYVVELTNVEDKDAYDLTFQATASSGMTFQSLQGATCSPACTPGDTWWVELASLPGEATHAITFTAQLDGDLSGLAHVTATVQLTTTAGAIAHTLDLDPPAVTINRNPGGVVGTGWQAITGSADDALGAGVALVEVSQDGNSWQPATGTRFWSAALDVPAGTSWPLYARATDYHGLVSPVETVTFTIDTVAPLITPTVPAVITDSVVLIDGLARDPAPAGARVQSVAVQLDNQSAAWRSATLYAIDAGGQQSWRYVWAVPYESNVAHRLRFRATDYAGNVTVTGWYDVVVQTLPNQAPVADAGVDQSVNTNATVILDGSSSYDPDGHALAFRWTQTGGTLVTLSDAAAISPTFTAPVATGVLSFTLSVTDSLGLSDPTPDEVQVLVAEYRNYLPLVLNGASSPAQQ
jgi:uncharacterized repeat protein (TIGR01451 family)